MGNTESTDNLVGYHVLRVQSENSPAAKAGLQVFFDFIVAANGIRLLKEDQTLVDQLTANENKPMVLSLYNTRTSSTRDVSITPTSDWGGAGMLGVTIRFSSVSQANEFVWHVLEVHPNSPAIEAGLEHQTDYIVGTSDLLFSSEFDLSNLVYGNLGKPIILYVYSTKTNDIRDVTLIPNDKWGGEGCLGAEVGYGFLHRVPLKEEDAPPASVPATPNTPIEAVVKGMDDMSVEPIVAEAAEESQEKKEEIQEKKEEKTEEKKKEEKETKE